MYCTVSILLYFVRRSFRVQLSAGVSEDRRQIGPTLWTLGQRGSDLMDQWVNGAVF